MFSQVTDAPAVGLGTGASRSERSLVSRILWPVLISTVGFGCAHGDTSHDVRSAGGPVLTMTKVSVLTAPDTVPLSEYLRLSVDAQGHFFVADSPSGTVLQFRADGAFVRRFGNKGRGPGELQSPRSLFVLPGDSLLLVNDFLQHKLVLYNTQTGAFRREVVSQAQELGSQWMRAGDTVFVGASFTRALVANWWSGADTMGTMLQAPQWIWERRLPAMRYGRTEALVYGDSVFMAIAGVDGIAMANRGGELRQIITFPAVRRKGIPEDVVASGRQSRASNDLAPPGSSVIGFSRLADGAFVVVYLDLEQLRALERNANEVRRLPTFGNYQLWITVVRPDLSSACVDGSVPINSDSYPSVHFAGDTLNVLSRLIQGDSVVTRVTAFKIATSACKWVQSTVATPTNRR